MHRILQRFGVDVVRYNAANVPGLMRAEIMERNGITLVLDVGANAGQYARGLRADGYEGRIVSFEPLSEPFAQLHRTTTADPLWQCRQVAIGNADGRADINVAANSWSSSLLPMTERHVGGAPDSRYVGAESVSTARLDSLAPALLSATDRTFLKLDVQGFELQALQGAQDTLRRVRAIETELSLVPLYEGQALFPDVVAHLYRAGLSLAWIARAFTDPSSGDVLQLESFFVRNDNSDTE